jgi:hypothetical protein
MTTLFMGVLAVLGLAVAGLWLPVLWIVALVLLAAVVVYVIGFRSRSRLEGGGRRGQRTQG